MKYLLIEVDDAQLAGAAYVIELYTKGGTFNRSKEIILDDIDEDTFDTVQVAT